VELSQEFILPMQQHLTALLNQRYLATLSLVALLVLLNQLLLQPSLLRLTSDAPVLNIAGRQRMLSQRLTKSALALSTTDIKDRKRYSEELVQMLRLWTSSHDGLRNGDAAMSLPGANSPGVNSAFDGLEPYYLQMRTAAKRLIGQEVRTQPGAAEIRDSLETILGAEGEYLARMDNVVGLYEREARDRVARLFWTGWAVMGLILVALLAIGRFILLPAIEVIDRQVDELGRARDELEDRVQARTRELQISTERHQALVEQLNHVARTNTIGEMASGLAHELNQPLGAIANYAEGCLVELASPRPAIAEVTRALEKLVATTLRAGKIIEGIRTFVTRHETRREPFDPNRTVEAVESILRDEARQRGLTLQTNMAPDLPSLWSDAIQIQQVIINLVRNAFDAVSSAQTTAPKVLIATRGADGGGVEFSVTDNGEGIDSERLNRVFDAYFSTRAGAMGMGLAICRTIIEAHQGRITVTSLPRVATTFRFTLPLGACEDDRTDSLHRG
jgi:two-component system sensor kinase FixL